MKLRPVSAAILLALSSLSISAYADDLRRPYIVQLADKPVASYAGGVDGLPATQPQPGSRLDLDSHEAQLYTEYLDQKQSTVQAVVAAAPILHTYKVVVNGFAAMLTDSEVRALQARSDVANVSADVPRILNTTYTSTFLGLENPNGIWSKVGGKLKAGEDMIVGIVDSGIWPESLSYADRVDAEGKPTFDPNASLAYLAPPARWAGTCQTGEGFTVAHCNNKLIGAQYFNTTYLSAGNSTHWSEFTSSPRDSVGGSVGHGGHGTHTSTTAAGNAGNQAVIGGIKVGAVSGVAPRARIASYKVCWTYEDATDPTGGKNTCYQGDSVRAIEKAVIDGVHVINFSISGGTSVTDVVEQAFFNASNAGVFVAASGGNSGPANQVAHISPWLTTVAASTHNRLLKAEVALGSNAKYYGASMNEVPLGSAAMIRSEDAGIDGADATRLRQCWSAAANGTALLDPVKVAGKIVTCDRGDNARVDKSLAVKDAGGVGMVLVDNGVGLVAEIHSVPTIHVDGADGALIKTYATTAGSTAALGRFTVSSSSVPAPVVAGFSSRGPNRFDPNVMKPDVTAPGVDIIAGVSAQLTPAQRADVVNGSWTPPEAYASYQGTSMSSPHVAGLATLIKQQRPTWTPSMIKSAMMTTGFGTSPDALQGAEAGATPWGHGAGHINPTGAADPGLVYAITEADYRKYMCGVGVATQCAGGTMAGYNLNLPSITINNVLGSVVVTRSVTNVGADATYTGTISVPGYSAVLSPASLQIPAGQTRSFTVTLNRTTAVDTVWNFGTMSWTDGTRVVRSPVNARSGKPVIAPELVTAEKATASRIISVSTGFTGRMNTLFGGLKEIGQTAYNLAEAPAGSLDTLALMLTACNNNAQGTMSLPVTVPAGALVAQFEVFNRDTTSTNGADDLDMMFINDGGSLLAYSANTGSNERLRFSAPPAGSYKLCVLNYRAANRASTDFKLSSAIVTPADRGGNFKVMVPSKVYTGSTASVSLSWSGLPAGKRFLGGAHLLDLNGAPASTTVVQVETNNPLPLGEPTMRAPKPDSGI